MVFPLQVAGNAPLEEVTSRVFLIKLLKLVPIILAGDSYTIEEPNETASRIRALLRISNSAWTGNTEVVPRLYPITIISSPSR